MHPFETRSEQSDDHLIREVMAGNRDAYAPAIFDPASLTTGADVEGY